MTPQEKAKELVEKFYWRKTNHNVSVIDSKQLALIAVDEIINAIRYTDAKNDLGYIGYWNKVKQEIENL